MSFVPTDNEPVGGYGYSSEYDMGCLVGTTLALTIYRGTSEIRRNLMVNTYEL